MGLPSPGYMNWWSNSASEMQPDEDRTLDLCAAGASPPRPQGLSGCRRCWSLPLFSYKRKKEKQWEGCNRTETRREQRKLKSSFVKVMKGRELFSNVIALMMVIGPHMKQGRDKRLESVLKLCDAADSVGCRFRGRAQCGAQCVGRE